MTIKRPDVVYNDRNHTYTLDGEKLDGVSTVAKVGDAHNVWGIASGWGFKLGYGAAYDVLERCVEGCTDGGCLAEWPEDTDELYRTLKAERMTPWHKKKDAADRGNWTHDWLEQVAQGENPRPKDYPPEVRGHIASLLHWVRKYNPAFVSTEVQVVSETHKFAGRYDIRAYVPRDDDNFWETQELVLVDLKTSKRVYPLTHWPQLAGYELASVEMGFPPTDAQYVLNSHVDGTPATFSRSHATADDFLAYLSAHRAIRRLEKAAKDAV